jgi:glycosyltransferase involved in cell wall biosynthesis
MLRHKGVERRAVEHIDHFPFVGYLLCGSVVVAVNGYDILPQYLKVGDVAVNTLEPTLVANAAFPNKVLQYMAAGIPVVSTQLQGLIEIFGEDAGISWASDSRAVVRVAEELAKLSKDELAKIAQARSAAVSKIFDMESSVVEFEKCLIDLVGVPQQ